jgi:genome maintenance exonuclease 1
MKKFHHAFVNLPNLEEEYVDGRRYYRTPEGNVYPSVTNILSRLPNEGLKEWQNRVGEDEAKRVSGVSTRRGKNLHQVCERYLLNEEKPTRGHMPDVQGMFS